MTETQLIVAATAVAGFAASRLGTIFDEILKPTLSEIGGDLRDRYVAWSSGNLVEVLREANELAEKLKQPVQPIPGRILFPLLHYASLEADAELRQLWAALLVNAATPELGPKTLPAYAEILKQLAPLEARILRYLFTERRGAERPATREQIVANFGISPDDYDVLVSDLDRLQLVEGQRYVGRGGPTVGELPNLVADRWSWKAKYKSVGLTALGERLLQHCTVNDTTAGTGSRK